MPPNNQEINKHRQYVQGLADRYQQGDQLENKELFFLGNEYQSGNVIGLNVDLAAECYLSVAADEVNRFRHPHPITSLMLMGAAREGSLVALNGMMEYAEKLEDEDARKLLARYVAKVYKGGENIKVAPDAEKAAYWQEIADGGHVGAAPAPVAGDYVGGVVRGNGVRRV